MEKTVLLTGADGFIGRHTIPLLIASGYTVHAVSLVTASSAEQRNNIFWHKCDLLNLGQQKELLAEIKPSHLLHFAWITTPGAYWNSLENLRWVQASLELILNFVTQGGRRGVLAGSCAEYDWSYGQCSEEKTPTRPSSLYGVCKHSLQEMLRHLSRQMGLSSAWGRIFFVYGPYEHPNRLVPTVIRSILKGKIAHCFNADRSRDFLFIKDVASAFVALLESSVEGPVNIGSGQPITLKYIVEFISQKLGYPECVKFSPTPLSQDEPALLVADVTRLTQEVGWRPKYKLEDGLRETIDWWKKEGHEINY